MGAIKMRVHTADETSRDINIHMTPVHNNEIVNGETVTLNLCFWPNMSSLHNIAFCSENVVSSKTGKKYAQIKHCLQEKIVSTVLNKYVGQNICGWKGVIMDQNSYKHAAFHFTRCQSMHWSHVDYLWIMVMFLSDVCTLVLTAPFQCRGSFGKQVM